MVEVDECDGDDLVGVPLGQRLCHRIVPGTTVWQVGQLVEVRQRLEPHGHVGVREHQLLDDDAQRAGNQSEEHRVAPLLDRVGGAADGHDRDQCPRVVGHEHDGGAELERDDRRGPAR